MVFLNWRLFAADNQALCFHEQTKVTGSERGLSLVLADRKTEETLGNPEYKQGSV